MKAPTLPSAPNVLRILKRPVSRIAVRSIVLVVLLTIGILFLQRQLDNRAESVATLHIEQARRLAELENAASLRADSRKIEEILPRMRALLPGEEAGVGFVEALDDLAQRHQITHTAAFQGVSPVDSQTVSGLREIGFTLTLNGGYGNITAFLKDFRTLSFLASLKRADATSTVNLFSVQELKMSGVLYLK